ncbi:hypothetical protein FFM54_03025 [Burkholderia pseudomallei]|nr:hypothetical protein FFM54_03025 [Burkholderia pseudomallei]
MRGGAGERWGRSEAGSMPALACLGRGSNSAPARGTLRAWPSDDELGAGPRGRRIAPPPRR